VKFLSGAALAFFVFGIGPVGAAAEIQATAGTHGYGDVVHYADQKPVQFPDFSVRFLGKRHIEVSSYSPGFTCYDFIVKKGWRRKRLSWTSGTGVADSVHFKFKGKKFALDLFFSKLRDLQPGELVIWQEE
jgi:hypothetical protein